MADSVLEILVRIKDEAAQVLTKITDTAEELVDALDEDSGRLLDSTTADSKKASKSLKDVSKNARLSSSDVAKLGKQKLTGFVGEVGKAKNRFVELRKEAKNAQDGLGQFSNLLAGAFSGLSVAAVVSETLKFSESITEVSTLVDSSIVSTKELSDTVLELGAAYGGELNNTANALYQAISAGAEAGAEANNLLEVSLKTAKAGVTDTQTAIDGITTVVNAFGYEMDQAGTVADIMFATMKGGKTTIQDIARNVAQVAPVASAAGVSFEEVSAGVITLTQQGTKTSVAMTQIRSAIASLLKPSKELTAIFNAAGYESGQAAIEAIGYQKALELVADATEGDIGQLQKLLGSIESVQAALGTTGANAERFAGALDATTNSAGAMDEAYNKVADSIAFKFKQAIVQGQRVLVELGEVLKPTLDKVSETLSTVSSSVSNFVRENQEWLGTIAEGVLAITAAFVGFKALKLVLFLSGVSTAMRVLLELLTGAAKAKAILNVGLLADAFKRAGGALKAFYVLASAHPIGALITALAALSVALYNVYDTYKELKKAEEEARQAQDAFLDNTTKAIGQIKERLAQYEQFRNVQIKGHEELSKLSKEELDSYKARLEGAEELYRVTDILGDVQRRAGLTAVEGYSEAVGAMKSAEEAIKNVNTQISILEKNQSQATDYLASSFSEALIKNVNDLKDAAEALSNEFKSFDPTNLRQTLEVVQGIDNALKSTEEGVSESAGLITDALRERLLEATTEEIQKFVENAKSISSSLEGSTVASAAASKAAIEALFTQMGVTVASELQKADQEVLKTFQAIVDIGGASTGELVQLFKANIGKLSTEGGLDDFRQSFSQAFEEAGGSALQLEVILEELEVRQQSLAAETDVLAQAMSEANSLLGVQTIQQAANGYAELETALDRVRQQYADGQVSFEQYQQGVVTYLQSTRDYLVNVEGVATEVADAMLHSSAVAEGLNIQISDTGEVTRITQEQIRDQYNQTYNTITENYDKIIEDQRTSMEAVQTINREGWDGVTNTIREAYNAAVAASEVAKSELLRTEQEYLDAVETGNIELIDKAKAEYDRDLENFREAAKAKEAASKTAIDAITEATKRASEEAKALAEVTRYSVYQPFQELSDLNRDFVAQLESQSALIQNTVFSSFDGYSRAVQQAEQAVANARDEHDRAIVKYRELSEALSSTHAPSAKMIAYAETSISSLRTLDSASLSNLQGQIDQAKSKLQELKDQSRDTLLALQSELAQIRGDTEKVQQIRFEQRLQELQLKLESARLAQDAQAQRDLEQAIATLGDIHRLKLRQIKEEERAQIEANKRISDAATDNTTTVRRFAQGGPVAGPGTGTSDSILSWLSNGEYVIDAATVREMGVGFFRGLQTYGSKMLNFSIPKFASGGLVSSGRASGLSPSISRSSPTRKVQVEFKMGAARIVGDFAETDADRLTRELDKARSVS